MENSEVILTIQWTKSDIVEALEKDGIEPCEENINKIISYRNLKYLEEQSIERGWEVIGNVIREKC
jgi:lambda repressor-like predicted transcriptional regulator